MSTRVRHLHAPQQHTDPKDQRVRAIKSAFARGADTIGWTEIETVDQAEAIHNQAGWDTYWPESAKDGSCGMRVRADGVRKPKAPNADPISWRTDTWRRIDAGSTFVHEGRENVTPSHYVNWVVLEHVHVGAVTRRVQQHWPSKLQPFVQPPLPFRRDAFEASKARLAKVIAASNLPTIVSLDANHTRLPSLVQVPGLEWHRSGPTHGRREIDFIGTRGDIDTREVKVIPGSTSDHDWVFGLFDLPFDAQEEPVPTVIRVGFDPNNRAIFLTPYMRDWWESCVRELGFRPTIVQGAWMVKNGGGAAASAGYHDGGGCIDLRVWDLTPAQREAVIRVTRRNGAGSWQRDERHGMDPHIHLVLGSDEGLSSGARAQWGQYLAGRDGLARNGPDYEWRPSPLVTKPPKKEWFDMATQADLEKAVEKVIRSMTFRVVGSGGEPKQWTLEQVLRNLEQDQDNDRKTLKAIAAAVGAKLTKEN